MKRGGRLARERVLLATVLDVIAARDGLCMDCPTTVYRLRWDEEAWRWKADFSHPPTCPVRRSRWFEHMFGDRMRALLVMRGVPLADYLDDPVGHHR